MRSPTCATIPSGVNAASVPALVSVAPTPAVPLLYVALRLPVVSGTSYLTGVWYVMLVETNVSTYCLVAYSRLETGSCVTATEVRPAKVSDVAPKEMLVVPIVTVLLLSAAFGMLVKFVPVRVGVVV